MNEERKGDWFQTFTGKQFWTLDPHPEEVFIEDIAHSLSQQCRFVGHTKVFYSVAQHCVLGANELVASTSDAFHFLMHDSAETYICDLPRPLKKDGGQFGKLYMRYEDQLEKAIATRFNLDHPMPTIVRLTDSRMLLTEKRELLTDPPAAWKASEGDYKPFTWPISSWTPQYAEKQFLNLFFNLNREYQKRFA